MLVPSLLGWLAFSVNTQYDSTLPSLLDTATGSPTPIGGVPDRLSKLTCGGVSVRNGSIPLGKFQNGHPQLFPRSTGAGPGRCILTAFYGDFHVAHPFTLLQQSQRGWSGPDLHILHNGKHPFMTARRKQCLHNRGSYQSYKYLDILVKAWAAQSWRHASKSCLFQVQSCVTLHITFKSLFFHL